MPLTEKGAKIKGAMTEEYGEEKGERVFYASKNKGTISGVDALTTTQPPGTPVSNTPAPVIPEPTHTAPSGLNTGIEDAAGSVRDLARIAGAKP